MTVVCDTTNIPPGCTESHEVRADTAYLAHPSVRAVVEAQVKVENGSVQWHDGFAIVSFVGASR